MAQQVLEMFWGEKSGRFMRAKPASASRQRGPGCTARVAYAHTRLACATALLYQPLADSVCFWLTLRLALGHICCAHQLKDILNHHICLTCQAFGRDLCMKASNTASAGHTVELGMTIKGSPQTGAGRR